MKSDDLDISATECNASAQRIGAQGALPLLRVSKRYRGRNRLVNAAQLGQGVSVTLEGRQHFHVGTSLERLGVKDG